MYLNPVSVSTAPSVMFRNRLLQIGRDKGLDDHAAICVRLVQNAAIEKCLRSIPGHERSDLISGEQFHFARTIAHRDTHSVASDPLR